MVQLKRQRHVADLTGGAVGQTGLVVSSQVEITGTGTLVPPAGGQQTQVAATSVCNLTLVLGHCEEATRACKQAQLRDSARKRLKETVNPSARWTFVPSGWRREW